ncbi:MAG TPA: (Fe-S)-binding protein [Candidatus Binatia bacterium]|nr:(Fe-S)-binding protein [Candidatus Binatia bacterium]
MTDVAAPAPPAQRAAPPPLHEPAAPAPRFLADVYEAASRCNKCSLCQAACPTYVVNPVEWETARGRVALVRDAIEGRLELRDIADGPLSTCLTCNNCVAVCPPRVPTAEIVSRARQELHEQEGYPPGQSWLLRSVLPRPSGTRNLHRLARATQTTGLYAAARGLGLTRWMGTVGAMAERVGPLPRRRADQRVRDLPAVTPPVRGRLGFLICCYQNLVAPEATEAAMRVLLANGYDLEVPETGCLGLPAQSMGDRHALVDMAVRTVTATAGLRVDALVGDVASCTGHVQRYDRILGDDRLLAADARRVAGMTDLASAYLERAGWRAPLGPLRWTVAIDEPCSLPVDGPARGVARALLGGVPQLRITPLEEAAMCCGGPGAYAQGQPERSEAILARKFEHVIASQAQVLVTENVSCLVQLRTGARRHAPGVRVMHLMEVLDASIEAAQRRRPLMPVR